MPSDQAKLAWARLLHDQRHRVFYRHPLEIEFVKAEGLDAWLDNLEGQVRAGSYVADPAPPIDVAKAAWHSRPGLQLSLSDQFVYHLLALQAVEVLGPRLEWSAESVRFSNRLSDLGKPFWFSRRFGGWKGFATVSLGKIAGEDVHFVLVSDVSGYYENIDIGRLVQELMAAGVDTGTVSQLRTLWNKWCGTRQRGIPQGCSPSDLFAEFYLDPFDHALNGRGLDHLRYVDDTRIFASDQVRARQALRELERSLRARGLNPQTAKTKILPAADARDNFARISRLLGRLSQRLGEELQIASDAGGRYLSPSELREYLRFDPDNPKPDVVNQAWDLFLADEFGPFDSTLFHYLLARLADQGSANAEGYCLEMLLARPEETDHILGYFSSVRENLDATTVDRLAELLQPEAELLFEHQRYLLLRWFYEEGLFHASVLTQARLEFSGGSRLLQPHWIAYIGDHATEQSDFDALEMALQGETAELMRATYLHALRKWGSTDRALLYGRCAGESFLVSGAVKHARSNSQ